MHQTSRGLFWPAKVIAAVGVLKVAMAVNAFAKAQNAIRRVSSHTDAAILFYSCGKDSITLLDMMAPHFKKIVLFHMYFVKGIPHVEQNLKWAAKTYKNIEISQAAHFRLTSIRREGIFCNPDPTVKTLTLTDLDNYARKKHGIEWTFYGNKKTDGLNRMLMLKSYGEVPIHFGTQKAYPLSDLKNGDVLRYIKQQRLINPVSYGMGQSNALGFGLPCLLWMRDNDPAGLQMIYSKFPKSKQVLFEYDSKASEIQD